MPYDGVLTGIRQPPAPPSQRRLARSHYQTLVRYCQVSLRLTVRSSGDPHKLLKQENFAEVLTELRRRRTSAFIGQRNSGAGLWQTGMASGGKLWSKRVLVPLCPPQSLTSVVAIHCLVARGPSNGDLDPVGEFAFS